MLHEEVQRYRELSGDNNPHTPISRIGGYLDGYEKAIEQKTGHWIKTKEQDDAEPLILWRCGECLTAQRLKTNYCPNCGAKMTESEDKE